MDKSRIDELKETVIETETFLRSTEAVIQATRFLLKPDMLNKLNNEKLQDLEEQLMFLRTDHCDFHQKLCDIKHTLKTE